MAEKIFNLTIAIVLFTGAAFMPFIKEAAQCQISHPDEMDAAILELATSRTRAMAAQMVCE